MTHPLVNYQCCGFTFRLLIFASGKIPSLPTLPAIFLQMFMLLNCAEQARVWR